MTRFLMYGNIEKHTLEGGEYTQSGHSNWAAALFISQFFTQCHGLLRVIGLHLYENSLCPLGILDSDPFFCFILLEMRYRILRSHTPRDDAKTAGAYITIFFDWLHVN